MKVFKRACTYNDKLSVHQHLLKMYRSAGDSEKADDLQQNILRQFGKESLHLWCVLNGLG